MSLENKQVLVTGYGFVGKHLVDQLTREKAEITVLDRNLEHLQKISDPNIKMIKTDLRHLEQKLEYDYVFHTCAVTHVGYGESNYIQTYDDNVTATLNLLKHVKARERFVFTSTAVVYSNVSGKHSEDEMLKPISLYGLSKVAAEALIKHFVLKENGKYTIFRFFNIYGEGQMDIFLIPQILKEAFATNKITIWNRDSERDFIYIKDIVKGMTRLMQDEKTANETINMGTGRTTTSGELADMISELMGGLEVVNKNYYDPNALATLVADTTKAERFGFRAETPLRKGLEEIIKDKRDKLAKL